jgi:serine/threonine protein kinase/streptogramin lyase
LLAHMHVLYSTCLPRSLRVLFGCSRLSREVVRMPLEGQHLGHYRLLRLLGSGGMGEVYLAEDARIGQQVAIKVIRSEGIAYPGSESAKEAARLFEREAKAIARLDHPNILPLYAYGEETLGEQLLTYLVMPYRKEGTLVNWLRQRGSAVPLSLAEVAPLLQQAAAALQHAHDQHVLHQDIKPSNFLVRLRSDQPERPDLLLSDFGIAKLTSATASASQSIRGTPTYMAPEQWDGHPVPTTDQYALAVMVYELLVGRPPFVGNPGQVMRQHYLVPPAAPSSLNGHLSPAIDAVLLHALAKQPEERFASVAAFARAFQEAVHSEGDLHATLAISPAEAESGTTRTLTLPGGRQVSVTVPAGVGDGAILRLEGQGLPYYAGGPAGPLVLTLAIPAEASPQPLSQDSTDPTVAASRPNAERPSVEEPSVPPAQPVAPGELELTVPASNVSETAPTVLATNATSLPTEVATPARHTPLPAQLARSATPPAGRPEAMVAVKPVKRSASRRIVLVGLAGLVIVALASGIVWFTAHQASSAGSITVFPVPTASNFPRGITAGPDGNLWFTEEGSQKSGGKIGRITPSGTITEFPVPTANSVPYEITAGPDDHLWFTEAYGNQIGRITTAGAITEFAVPTASSGPVGITAGPDGNLWFTEDDGNQIGRITPNGKITEFPLPTANSRPDAITAGPDGNLWFTEDIGNQIGRITPNGKITEFPLPTANSSLEGIAAGPDGNLWFTISLLLNNVNSNTNQLIGSKIGRITPSGTVTEFSVPTALSDPQGITAGPDGNLWFTENFANQIGRIATSGTITEFPVSLNGSPTEITAGPDGNLWFTDGTGDNIERITSGK